MDRERGMMEWGCKDGWGEGGREGGRYTQLN